MFTSMTLRCFTEDYGAANFMFFWANLDPEYSSIYLSILSWSREPPGTRTSKIVVSVLGLPLQNLGIITIAVTSEIYPKAHYPILYAVFLSGFSSRHF